jgi:hypothetical protein
LTILRASLRVYWHESVYVQVGHAPKQKNIYSLDGYTRRHARTCLLYRGVWTY